MEKRGEEEGEWDLEFFGPELEELKGLDFDLELTGFDEREIEDLLADPDLDDRANLVPDVPENPVTIPGDLWLCGPHKVLAADSTGKNVVSRLCGRTKPFLMAT